MVLKTQQHDLALGGIRKLRHHAIEQFLRDELVDGGWLAGQRFVFPRAIGSVGRGVIFRGDIAFRGGVDVDLTANLAAGDPGEQSPEIVDFVPLDAVVAQLSPARTAAKSS
jgi:hypothetical protein